MNDQTKQTMISLLLIATFLLVPSTSSLASDNQASTTCTVRIGSVGTVTYISSTGLLVTVSVHNGYAAPNRTWVVFGDVFDDFGQFGFLYSNPANQLKNWQSVAAKVSIQGSWWNQKVSISYPWGGNCVVHRDV